jgi:hypothetical protein
MLIFTQLESWWQFSIQCKVDKLSILSNHIKHNESGQSLDLKGLQAVLLVYLPQDFTIEQILHYTIQNSSEKDFKIGLILNAKEEQAKEFKEKLLTIHGFKDVTYISFDKPGQITFGEDFDTSLLDSAIKDFKTWNALKSLQHKTANCLVTLHPFLKENNVVIACHIRLAYEKRIRKVHYGCSIYLDNERDLAYNTKVYGGISYKATEKSSPESYEKSISGSAALSLGMNPNVTLGVGGGYKASGVNENPHHSSSEVPMQFTDQSNKTGISLKYELLANTDEHVVDLHHIFWFSLGKLVTEQHLRLLSIVTEHHKGAILQLEKSHDLVSQAYFGMEKHTVFTPSNVIIGTLIGEPKVGKTSFINVVNNLYGKTESPRTSTGGLIRYEFNGVNIDDKAYSFFILDTRGFFFDVEQQKDLVLLRSFVRGLAPKFAFSRPIDEASLVLDTSNALSHIILGVNAFSVWKREPTKGSQTSWFSWFWSPTSPEDSQKKIHQKNLEKFYKLYEALVNILAEERYKGDKVESQKRIYILVTHLDMLELETLDSIKARDHIKTTLAGLGFPDNYIVFGEQTCKWNNEDLASYNAEVEEFFGSVKPEEDWVQKRWRYIHFFLKFL